MQSTTNTLFSLEFIISSFLDCLVYSCTYHHFIFMFHGTCEVLLIRFKHIISLSISSHFSPPGDMPSGALHAPLSEWTGCSAGPLHSYPGISLHLHPRNSLCFLLCWSSCIPGPSVSVSWFKPLFWRNTSLQ